MSPSKNCCKDLLDHFILSDDDLLQLLLHDPPLIGELLKDIAQASLFACHLDFFPVVRDPGRAARFRRAHLFNILYSISPEGGLTYSTTKRLTAEAEGTARLTSHPTETNTLKLGDMGRGPPYQFRSSGDVLRIPVNLTKITYVDHAARDRQRLLR